MLPKKYRLKKGKSFELVVKKGERITDAAFWFSLKYLPNNRQHPRVGVVVKKKSFALASKRNQFKRRIFGLLENEIKRSSRNLDMVVFVHKEPKDRSDREFLLKTILGIIK